MRRKHNPVAMHAKTRHWLEENQPALVENIECRGWRLYSARPTWATKDGKRRRRWHWSLTLPSRGQVLAKMSGKGDVLSLYVHAGKIDSTSIVEYEAGRRRGGLRVLDRFELVEVA